MATLGTQFPKAQLRGRNVINAPFSLIDLGKRAGIHLHPHLLRHTVASNMVRNGANLRGVQEFLGHASLETTELYLDVEPADIEDAVKRVNFNGEGSKKADI
jgi:site-specific recombinase XerD